MTCTRTNSSQILIPLVFLLSKVASEPVKRYQKMQRFKARIELYQDSYNMERRILTGIGMFIGFPWFSRVGAPKNCNFESIWSEYGTTETCSIILMPCKQCVLLQGNGDDRNGNQTQGSGCREAQRSPILLLLRKALFLKKTSAGYRFEQMILKEEYVEIFCFLVGSISWWMCHVFFFIILHHVMSCSIILYHCIMGPEQLKRNIPQRNINANFSLFNFLFI